MSPTNSPVLIVLLKRISLVSRQAHSLSLKLKNQYRNKFLL
jgi:hypothetical protein